MGGRTLMAGKALWRRPSRDGGCRPEERPGPPGAARGKEWMVLLGFRCGGPADRCISDLQLQNYEGIDFCCLKPPVTLIHIFSETHLHTPRPNKVLLAFLLQASLAPLENISYFLIKKKIFSQCYVIRNTRAGIMFSYPLVHDWSLSHWEHSQTGEERRQRRQKTWSSCPYQCTLLSWSRLQMWRLGDTSSRENSVFSHIW